MHPLLAPLERPTTLDNVLDGIAAETKTQGAPAEESKQPTALPQKSVQSVAVTINVNLSGLKDRKNQKPSDVEKEARSGAELSTGTSVRMQKHKLTETKKADEPAAPRAQAVSPEEQILALTRQQMSAFKEQQRP